MALIGLGKADVIMIEWNILQILMPDGNYGGVFLGYSINDGMGRLSTLILTFDENTRTGSTLSGSTYSLIEEPGMPHHEAIYALESKLGEELVAKLLENPHEYGGARFRYPIR